MSDTPHSGAIRTHSARAPRFVAAIVALALAVGAVILPVAAPSASAASYGPGYHHAAGFLGAYSANGVNMYCLEQQKASPLGTTSYAGLQQWPTASADNNARVNWAIYTYGQSGDPRWTAAVNLFVWSLMEPTYNSHAPNFNGDTYFGARVPAGAERNAVYDHLNTIRAGAASITAGTTTGTATGTFSVSPTNDYLGTLNVSVSPTNMTGSITLTNGIFLSTGTNTIAGVTNGASLQVKGVPTPDGEPYKISATGTFTGPMRFGPRIAVYSTPGQQNVAYVGDRGAPIATLNAIDPMFRLSDFVPELTSAVSDQILQPGDVFTDNFTFAAGMNPEAGSVVPWLQYPNGNYATITAEVTLYRVSTRPVPGGPIPSHAVPVQTFTITTTPAVGPTAPYSWSSAPLTEAGYYVAVSTIRSADQLPTVQPFIPTDYEWTDGWGVVSETAVLMEPGRSEATAEAIVGEAVTDTVFLPDWVPPLSRIEWEIYKRPTGSPAPLESSDPEAIDPAAVCTPETLYTTLSRNDPPIGGSTMDSPSGWNFGEPGVFDWVVVVRDGAGGPVLWRAPCGVVSERTVVRQLFQPQLTSTVSDQILQPGDVFTDVFTFAVEDSDAPEIGPWMQDFDGSYAVVTAQVTVYRVSSKPVPGDPIPADAEPVETFTISTTSAEGPTVPYTYSTAPLTRGGYYVAVSVIEGGDQPVETQRYLPDAYEWTDGWGVVSETAVLMEPGSSTATANAVAGLAAGDTVFLPDFIPEGAWLDWEVYMRPADAEEPLESEDTEAIDPAAVCTSDTLYTTLGMEITGSIMTTPDDFTFDIPGVFDWVAIARDGEGGAELWRAPCGVVSERTVVELVDIVTEAQSSTTHDGPIFDVALVSGTIEDGDELTFRAYTPKYDADDAPVCDASNLVYTSDPVSIDAGVYDQERIESTTTTAGGTTVWWVETLTHEDGTIVHAGECGLDTETSTRPKPPLPGTGADGIDLLVWWGSGALGAGLLLTLLVASRAWRRRHIAG